VLSRRATLEIAAVALTAALHFVFYDVLPGRGIFIVATVAAWTTYLAVRIRHAPELKREYGLSRHALKQSMLAAAVVFVVGGAICLSVALGRGQTLFAPSMVILAFLYPLWGLLQQLLVQAMVVRNLAPRVARPLVVVIAGLLFGVVHLPHVLLAASTAILGSVFTVIFLRWPSVWALGLCHGWLGVLFYFWVLQRNPWLEIVAGV
jgi:hypothetical protein